MTIQIFDVEHGFCAYIVADNGNTILIDCGHNTLTGFRPTAYLQHTGCTGIERFIVSNYDGDHLSDLSNLYDKIPIGILHKNNSISSEQLKNIKLEAGPLRPGIETLIKMMHRYTFPEINPPFYPNLEFEMYCNDYPTFEDTNNLSVVTFISSLDIRIIFPGDLEKEGWLKLLQNKNFVEKLKNVNAFVASHHGRESGYCEDVFDICSPEIIIISDESIKYETQKDFYRKHAKGIIYNNETRYIFTTRSDGHITLSQRVGSSPLIHCSPSYNFKN